MPKRFYAAWALVVLLALGLPIAIPYAIWPTAYYAEADDTDCENLARMYAGQYSHPTARAWPLSVHVNQCVGNGLMDPAFRYDVNVHARGPYGIPFASAHITNDGGDSLDPDGGRLLGLVALMLGVFAVSVPFLAITLRSRFRRTRLVSA